MIYEFSCKINCKRFTNESFSFGTTKNDNDDSKSNSKKRIICYDCKYNCLGEYETSKPIKKTIDSETNKIISTE